MPDVAIFDLDLTLISIDSTNKWVDLMCRKGLIKDKSFYLERKKKYDQDYIIGKLNTKEAYRSFIEPMLNEDMSILNPHFNKFAKSIIDENLYPAAKKCIDNHKYKSDDLLLISGCIDEIVRPIGLSLGFKDENIIGTETKKYNNRFTGEVVVPLSFGYGKCLHFDKWMKKRNKKYKQSSFYSDSINDLPLLSLVDNAICINPDNLLKKKAEEKNWIIEYWSL
jgi:HAD superfamily hydrolase (TIGR01490 family)